MTNEQIVNQLRRAGVVGAGGAGFPTYVKASGQVDTFIVNAAECEPLIRSNQELLRLFTEKIVDGMRVMMRATKANNGVIAIKAKHSKVIATLRKVLEKYPELPVSVYLLRDFYPAGDEHVLVYQATGRIVPPGDIPSNVGVMVNNVETLYHVSEAMENKPFMNKWVTVTGAVKEPMTVLVPVGISFHHLIEVAGGTSLSSHAVVEGGPMMGKVVDGNGVVKRTTAGCIVLPADHSLVRDKMRDIQYDLRKARNICCHCGFCTEVCPRYLLGHNLMPNKTMVGATYQLGELAANGSPWLCSECGICETFACPMELSPRRVNAWLKREFTFNNLKPLVEPSRGVHPGQDLRLVHVKRLVARLGLSRYDLPAPINNVKVKPPRVELLFQQHVGVPATPIVERGQRVNAGDIIADISDDRLGVPIHASVTGLVTSVTEDRAIIETGGVCFE